ncbi:MAG: hypothetical protein VKJ04_09790 [Vampirovibrionales bacterium]|nr:hypothetical protein [Vampirovibrionales bacterium]
MGSIFTNPNVLGSAAVAALGGTAYGVSEYAKSKKSQGGHYAGEHSTADLIGSNALQESTTRGLDTSALRRPLQA